MSSVWSALIDFLPGRIKQLEQEIVGRVKMHPAYQQLLIITGAGMVLALTIMLEKGPILRFAKVGNYAFYCRKVGSKWTSNDRRKGKGNAKNGNLYPSWAFGEAAIKMRSLDTRARSYYQRKLQRTNTAVAQSALPHKLCRAAYYIMRDGVPFNPQRVFR